MAQLTIVDRATKNSVTAPSVAARYDAAEKLLDQVWQSVVRPLVHEVGTADVVRFKVPGSLLRLPLTTARCRFSGQSLVHVTEPLVDWRNGGTLDDPPTCVVRIDGHFRNVADTISRLRCENGTALLLMGCRTAELLPLLAATGARWAVVSSWDVEDRHCASVGDEIEERIESGLRPSAALRSVQAARSHRPPYEWGGYAVVDLS